MEDNNTILQLSKINVDDKYCKEWNEKMTDFVVLTKNGEMISKSLYRVGGMGGKPDGKGYFMLLKYVEAYYSAEILRISKAKNPKHLSGRWCIIDSNGVEKKEFNQFDNPYLVRHSHSFLIKFFYAVVCLHYTTLHKCLFHLCCDCEFR